MIEVFFPCNKNTAIISATQWDLNRKIKLNNVAISDNAEIHFANNKTMQALVVDVVDSVAEIPNILLQSDNEINTWVYDDLRTKKEITIKVKARNKPSDYVYTETEIKRYEDLEKRIEALEKGGVVRYDKSQSLTDAEKLQARQNIGVAEFNDIVNAVIKAIPNAEGVEF